MDNNDWYPYITIFGMLLAAGMGFPIPEELPIVLGGVWIGHPESRIHWWIMLPVCIIGVVISDGILYTIGRFWGRRLLEFAWIKAHVLPAERRERIENNFHEYGIKILLFARFLPAIRSPIFITAGIMRFPFSRFLLADGLYAIPGVSLLFFLGCWFTDQFMVVVEKAESYRPLIIVMALVAVGSYLVFHFLHRPVTTGDPKELPAIASQMAQKFGSHDPVSSLVKTDPALNLPNPGHAGDHDHSGPDHVSSENGQTVTEDSPLKKE